MSDKLIASTNIAALRANMNLTIDRTGILKKLHTAYLDLFRFEKVPEHIFVESCKECYGNFMTKDVCLDFYDRIKLPKSATSESAGFDFFAPFTFHLCAGSSMTIPTGIRWVCDIKKFRDSMESILSLEFAKRTEFGVEPVPTTFGFDSMESMIGLSLNLYPRSGLGFKHRLGFADTVAIIDSDYANSDNYGHILVKMWFPEPETVQNYGIRYPDGSWKEVSKSGFYSRQELLEVKQGTAMCQGIVTPYLKHPDYASNKSRNGGFGSTTDKE